jgi:phosphoribosylamine--glycine ligase
MKVLLIGSGAREHALAWKLRQAMAANELYVAPGNPGTAQLATNLAVQPDDIEGLLAAANRYSIEFTIVGPEGPLEKGIVDAFTNAGHRIFGPTKAAARIETSKVFAKELMMHHGIPTAPATAYRDSLTAKEAVLNANLPVVIKADGLAGGKGVVVCETHKEAFNVIEDYLDREVLGDAGTTLLVEDFLVGHEVSVFGFTDGTNVSALAAACDYKRLGDRDVGPNTGGMGSYSPPPYWDEQLERLVQELIMQPILAALREMGCAYKGMLYAGLMLTDSGPQVVEFNCRFGDPETQVLMPRMESEILPAMIACSHGDISEVDVSWSPEVAVGVVLASHGYPGEFSTGHPIDILQSVDDSALMLHAGTDVRTTRDGSMELVTAGGRVLTVVGKAHDLATARIRAYESVDRVTFLGKEYRSDIAKFPHK